MALRLLKNPLFIGIAFILMMAIIYSSSRLLPFVDLPNHLAEATIFKYLLHGDPIFQSYYSMVPWFYPNTFHTYFTSLFPSVEWGDRCFFLLYLLMMPVSIFLVLKKMHGNLWVGLLVFLFIFNYNVTFGFVGYFMAIPFIMLLFYLLLPGRGVTADRSPAGMVLKALLLVMIYFMHAQAALFAMMLLGFVHLVMYRKCLFQLWRTAVILLPVVLLFFTWWKDRGDGGEEGTLSYLLDYYLTDYFHEFGRRSAIFVLDFYHLFPKPWGYVAGALFSVAIILPLLIFWPDVRERLGRLTSGTGKYLLVFLCTALVCFLFLPSKLPGQTPLFERFSTILFLAFILVQSVLIPERKAVKRGIVGITIVYMILWAQYFYQFNQVNKAFDNQFLAEPGREGLVYGLMYDHTFRGRPVYIHFPNYHTIWNRGIAASKIIDYRFGIVRRKEGGRYIPFYNEWIGVNYETVKTRPADYLLVHGKAMPDDPNLADFTETGKAGAWTLFHRKH